MTVQLRAAPYAVWRALAATVLIMVAATAAHTWSGGRAPGLPGLLVLAATVFGCGVLVLRRHVSMRVLLPVVAVAQGSLHTAFTALTQQHDHGAAGAAASATAGVHWSWQMLAAHVVGTLAAGIVWRCFERAVEVLLVRPAGLALRPLETLRSAVTSGRERRVRRLDWLVSTPRRGPPWVAHVS